MRQIIHGFGSVFSLAVFFVVLTTVSLQAARRPNVVVILTDDQGWGDLSLNGNTNLATPSIDTLARDGASFDRFYVCPVCSPTRAEFLTGRYHPRSGVYSTSAGGERMDLDEMTIAQTFKAAGYVTAAYGKWHNGMQYPYHPNARGFDEFYGFCSGHWGNYFSPPLEHNGRIVRGRGFVIDDFTDRAMDFMAQHKDQSFFVYLPFNTPHSPMQVPDRWWNRFKDKQLDMHNREPKRENLGHVRAALAMCENIDWNVGRILKQLERLDLANDTIVVYFCDNGPNGYRWNGGMKGRKGSTDEGGVRSPLLIRWPGKIPAQKKVMQIGAAIDLLPTLADLAQIKVASEKPLDGVSLKSLLLGEPSQSPDRMIFSHWRNRVSVRTQQFRLDQQGKLFDLALDPGQYRDVSGQHTQVTARLRKAVETWKQEVLAGYDQDKRAFVIGHRDFKYTQIPARDGKAHGTIKRSNRYPNCSFFTHWTSLDDKISWPVEVDTSGDYAVEVYYTCLDADVGSVIELSLGDSRVQGQITSAHDPSLQGAENDRVKRTESYVKDFRPLTLGTIHLQQGRGELVLRALSKPGAQVMDFRLLMLTRVASH
jgi:arylsulfatase A-like enzyme